jgi:hypothetical protein
MQLWRRMLPKPPHEKAGAHAHTQVTSSANTPEDTAHVPCLLYSCDQKVSAKR